MHWSKEISVPVEATSTVEATVIAERTVQLQRVVVEPPSANLVHVLVGHEHPTVSSGWLVPPQVIGPGTRITATVQADASKIKSSRVLFIGQAIPSLAAGQDDQHRFTTKECAKMLGATLGGLAMAADEETLREALAWWNWNPDRLRLVYEANAEIERLESVDDARTVAAYSKVN